MAQYLHAALGQAKPSSHPLFEVSRNYSGAYTWWLLASEPSFPPAKVGVGQMDGELAGVSAPHVLGPGQSPCHHQGQVCACASRLVVLLTKPCCLVTIAVSHGFFPSSSTGWISPGNVHVQKQSYLEC